MISVGLPGTIVPPFASIGKNAQSSEAIGAEAIWFPDHLMGFWPQALWTRDITPLAAIQPSPHVFFDPFVAMAAAAAVTTRVKIGTAVTQAAGRHPAHLAQAFLSLSHMSGGRAIMGLGTGESENLAPYGLDDSRPAAKLAEALRIVRLLWEHNEPVSFEGDFWRLRDAVLGLGPAPGAALPPIWLAALGPKMLRLTGEVADGWLPLKMPPHDYAAKLRDVQAAAAMAGRAPDVITPALWAFTVIHDNERELEQLADHPLVKGVCLMFASASFERHGAEHPLGRGREGFRDYIPTRLSRDDALAAIDRIPAEVVRDHLLVGTPDQLRADLRQLEAAGLRHAVLWNITFLADARLVGRSFRLLEELIKTL